MHSVAAIRGSYSPDRTRRSLVCASSRQPRGPRDTELSILKITSDFRPGDADSDQMSSESSPQRQTFTNVYILYGSQHRNANPAVAVSTSPAQAHMIVGLITVHCAMHTNHAMHSTHTKHAKWCKCLFTSMFASVVICSVHTSDTICVV